MFYPKHTFPGTLIVIDGSLGSGKDTQVKILLERLATQPRAVRLINFPRYKIYPYGQLIREYLDDKKFPACDAAPKLASIPFAEDRREAKPIIEQWLASGDIVVANRYVASNLAYQAAKLAKAERTKFANWLHGLEYGHHQIPRENCLIYLKVPAQLSIELADARSNKSGNPEDQRDGHEKSEHRVDTICQVYTDFARAFDYWHLVQCAAKGGKRMLPVETIHEKIWRSIQPYLDL